MGLLCSFVDQDNILRDACGDHVSFIFRSQSHESWVQKDVDVKKDKDEETDKKATETRIRPRRGGEDDDVDYAVDQDDDD